MTRVVKNGQEYGLIKIATNAECVFAHLIVPEPAHAIFSMSINPFETSYSTDPMIWPMSNLEMKQDEMRESQFIASVDYFSSFWHFSKHVHSQALHAFVAYSGIFVSMRTLQCGRNSAQNFKRKVEPCF